MIHLIQSNKSQTVVMPGVTPLILFDCFRMLYECFLPLVATSPTVLFFPELILVAGTIIYRHSFLDIRALLTINSAIFKWVLQRNEYLDERMCHPTNAAFVVLMGDVAVFKMLPPQAWQDKAEM